MKACGDPGKVSKYNVF